MARHRKAYPPVMFLAGLLFTIPSLALFQLLVPITGLTVTTVEVALVGYTLLILDRNILEGLRGVPPSVREAARGMGLTRKGARGEGPGARVGTRRCRPRLRLRPSAPGPRRASA